MGQTMACNGPYSRNRAKQYRQATLCAMYRMLYYKSQVMLPEKQCCRGPSASRQARERFKLSIQPGLCELARFSGLQ